MIRTVSLVNLLIFIALSSASAQRWAVRLQMNEYYPLFAEAKGYYPMLWYSDAEGRGVLLGGFGGGVSYASPLKGNWSLKTQANVSRSRYYEEPVLFTDDNGQSLGARAGITTNLNINAFCMPVCELSRRWQAGIGLGVQSALLSKSDYGEVILFGEKTKLKFTNQSIQPLVVTLPVEITYLFGRFSLSYRLEAGLTKISRLPFASGERFIAGVIELGYRLGADDRTITPVLNR